MCLEPDLRQDTRDLQPRAQLNARWLISNGMMLMHVADWRSAEGSVLG